MFTYGILFSITIGAQTLDSITVDSSKIKPERLSFKLEMLSRYLWRGQPWGANYPALQPTIEYKLTPKVTLGFWGTTNFKSDYYNTNGSYYKGYQEIDFYVSYAVSKMLTVQLWDYYWPSVEKINGISNRYFNYGSNGVKTVDGIVIMDFTSKKLPITVQISTLIAGNDFRATFKGMRQNFTTYGEISYTNLWIPYKIKSVATVGVVFNNQAKYYVAGDYDRWSWVNLSCKFSKDFTWFKRWQSPVSIAFIHNAATQNTAAYGKNFVIISAGIGLY